jgi:hypothetical protein
MKVISNVTSWKQETYPSSNNMFGNCYTSSFVCKFNHIDFVAIIKATQSYKNYHLLFTSHMTQGTIEEATTEQRQFRGCNVINISHWL